MKASDQKKIMKSTNKPKRRASCKSCSNWDPGSTHPSERVCWISNEIRNASDQTCKFISIERYPRSEDYGNLRKEE
jgi:hypothetical protein